MRSVTVKYAAKKENEGQLVIVDGDEIALFRVDGQFFAVENRCPHRGGYLAEGMIREKVVVCPFHGWSFDLASGQSTNHPGNAVGCFPVAVAGDEVTISLP